MFYVMFKIITYYESSKAFLVVQGKAGAFIDGSWVYPNTSSSSSSSASEEIQQTITPLANNSEFEIHSKRFRFTYPPKDVRKVLLATPVGTCSLELSGPCGILLKLA